MAKMLQSPKRVGIPVPVVSFPSAFLEKVLQAELGQRNVVLCWCVGQVRMVAPSPRWRRLVFWEMMG